jgi:EAL domain-containing protein (putative c-di-GMP-specific phosphodiesterase class I)
MISALRPSVAPATAEGGRVKEGTVLATEHAPVPARDRAAVPWLDHIGDVLTGRRPVRLAYQPIVDLVTGTTVGYETLARFDGPVPAGPDRWFAEAEQHGLGAELEAHVLRLALAGRHDVPPNCFLTVNVSPHLLSDPRIGGVLAQAGDLGGVVLELTEHVAVTDEVALQANLAALRSAGCRVAVDDAGSGYAGLHQLLVCRPDIIKLDRALVTDVGLDPAKQALVELLGAFSDRLDAFLLAEGIETLSELEVLLSFGVPLGQGYLLGKPAPPWSASRPAVAGAIRNYRRQRSGVPVVAEVIETAHVVPAGAEHPAGPDVAQPGAVTVVLADNGAVRRLGWASDLDGRHSNTDRPLCLSPATTLPDAARRAMTRPAAERFSPLVCTDSAGRYLGVVRIERLVARLAELTQEIGRTS